MYNYMTFSILKEGKDAKKDQQLQNGPMAFPFELEQKGKSKIGSKLAAKLSPKANLPRGPNTSKLKVSVYNL